MSRPFYFTEEIYNLVLGVMYNPHIKKQGTAIARYLINQCGIEGIQEETLKRYANLMLRNPDLSYQDIVQKLHDIKETYGKQEVPPGESSSAWRA